MFLAYGQYIKPTLADGIDGLIDKALKGAGLTRQLETLGQAMLYSIPEDALPDKKIKNEASAFVSRSANRETVISLVRTSVKEDLEADTLDKIVQFYDSRVGKKVGAAMAEGLGPSSIRKVREGRKLLTSLSEARIETLRQIVAAQSIVKTNAELLQTTIHGLIDGSLSEGTDSARVEEMKARVKVIEAAILAGKQRTEETALISCAHAFRTLDDDELHGVASFYESEPAQRFQRAVRRGLERAVYTTARALGEVASKPPATSRSRGDGAPKEQSHQMGGSEDAPGLDATPAGE